MSKNLSNYKLNQNLSQVQKDLATQSSIAETGYLRSQRQDSKIQNTAQEKINAIQLEIESRGNPSKVAGSIIGNLGKIINYFFGNAKEPETIDPNPKDQKVEQDLQEKKIEKKLDEIVEKKRKVGSIREFYVRHHHGFYYEKPMMSLENSELREKFKEQKLIIDRKEGPITTAELSKYAETLLNLNLNLKGCGELNSSSDFRQIRKEIKKLSDLSEKTFTDLEKLNQTSDSQFQLGFFGLYKDKPVKAAHYFSKALELKKSELANLSEEERKSKQADMKWFNHFAAIFAHPKKAIELLQEEIHINPNHQSYEHLAIAYTHEGKLNDAILCLKKGLEINPEAKNLNLKIARSLIKQNRAEEALRHIDREIEISIQSNDLHNLKDAVLFKVEYENRVGNYDKSIELLELLNSHTNELEFYIKEFDTKIPRAHTNLKKAELEEKRNNPNKAIEYKKLAIKDLNDYINHGIGVPQLHDIETLAKLEIEIDGFEESRLKNAKMIDEKLEFIRVIKENNNKQEYENGYIVYAMKPQYSLLSLFFLKECALILEQTKQDSIDQKTKENLQKEGLAILDSSKGILEKENGSLVRHKIKHIHQEFTKTFVSKLAEYESNQPSTSPQILSGDHASLQNKEINQKIV